MKRIQNIILLISILALSMIASALITSKGFAQATSPTYVIEPSTHMIGPGPAIGQTFTVNVELQGVTTTNVPNGVGGVEVHVSWNTSLVEPENFTNEIGTANGVFNGSTGIIYGINGGFYDENLALINNAPYTNATSFAIAGASTTGAWWGLDGIIAQLTFKVDQQPQPVGICPIVFTSVDLTDSLAAEVVNTATNATVFITKPTTYSETVNVPWAGNYTVGITTDANPTFPVNLDFTNITGDGANMDFNLTTYGSYCNITVPNNFMWSIPTNNWTVMIDNAAPNPPITNVAFTSDSSNTYIWLNFTAGDHMISLMSTNYVPEFPVTSILLLLMATTLATAAAATALRKRRIHF